MVLVKNWQFFLFLILGKIGQENVFYDVLERKNAFPGIKNKKFKKSRKWKFSKGVSPWFWSKIVNFFLLLFHVKKAGKMRFTIFQKEKTCFYAIKTRSSKSRKIRIFSQGLVHNFGLKLSIFPSFCFRQKKARKMCFTIFQKEKTSFYAKKQEVQKVEKLEFFQRGQSMVFVKIGNFSILLFQATQARNLPFTIFQNKNIFSRPFKEQVKKVERLKFLVLVKNCQFFRFFILCKKRLRKCVSRYSRKKKRLSTLTKQEV